METLQNVIIRPFKGTDNLLKDEVEIWEGTVTRNLKKKKKNCRILQNHWLFFHSKNHIRNNPNVQRTTVPS